MTTTAKVFFMAAQDVSKEYGIPLSTVYYRIMTHKYRVNENNEVLISDVEKLLVNATKRGRPLGSKDKKQRRQRKDYEKNKHSKTNFKKF